MLIHYKMDEWQVLILGAVQGAAEFLPVSSSGHLALLQMFFGFPASGALAFDILLHCATTLAVLLFFREDIAVFLTQWLKGLVSPKNRNTEGWRFGWAVLAGTAVTALVALPLKNAVEAAMNSRLAVGAGLLTTAGLLCIVPLLPERNEKLSARIALVVGLVQGLAVFPGVSRSGSTLAAALFMGLAAKEAFRFSFLLSVPAILGAAFLEGAKALPKWASALPVWAEAGASLPPGWAAAVAAAFLLGWLSLKFLRSLVLSGRWPYFGGYCFFLGLAAVVSEIAARF
jgi:undecaprenyl-diphosphatase